MKYFPLDHAVEFSVSLEMICKDFAGLYLDFIIHLFFFGCLSRGICVGPYRLEILCISDVIVSSCSKVLTAPYLCPLLRKTPKCSTNGKVFNYFVPSESEIRPEYRLPVLLSLVDALDQNFKFLTIKSLSDPD